MAATTSARILLSAPTPLMYGQAVSFAATITPEHTIPSNTQTSPPGGNRVPTGTITFSVDGNQLGTAVIVQPVQGSTTGQAHATSIPTTPSAGTHSVAATYSGVGNFKGSTGTLTLVVSKANTTMTATAAVIRRNPSTGNLFIPSLSGTLTNTATATRIEGATITFTALSGTVNFGHANTNSSGTATLTNVPVSRNLLPALLNSPQYTAAFAGDANTNPSSATAALTFQS